MRHVSTQDPELDALLQREVERQQDELELIASENYASPAVIAAMGSLLTNKYAEGLPGKRYYGGCQVVDQVEQLAIDRALRLFGAAGANVQPHSGAQANAAMYLALLEPGDTLLGLDLSHGGHLTHGSPVNFSGRMYRAVHYGLDVATGRIDMDQVRDRARAERPKVIVTGASAYPRTIDFAAFAEIADEVGALLVADIAHIAGLVVAGLHPSPVPHCAMVSTTTHKTLRGPRGGLLLADASRIPAMNKSVFPGIQGGPLMHVIAAKAVAFGEALQPSFSAYARRVVDNAAALAEVLVGRGYSLVSGGTDNHLMLVDLGERLSGKDAENALSRAAITVNKNTVPGERRSPFVTSGVRIGTPAMTTRGFGVDDARQVGGWIADVLDAPSDEAVLARVRGEVIAACRERPIPGADLHHD